MQSATGFSIESDISQGLLFAEAMAIALETYSRKHDGFRLYLRQLLQRTGFGTEKSPSREEFPVAADLLTPPNETVARIRAEWLVRQLATDKLPGASRATRVLANVFTDRNEGLPFPDVKCEDYGALPAGRKGVFITGLIVGGISQVVVVRRDTHGNPSLQADLVLRASSGVVAKALQDADLNARELEPELAAWLFGERATRLFSSSSHTRIDAMVCELDRLDITYATCIDDHGTAALAISPAFDGSYKLLTWGLDPLTEAISTTCL